MREKEQVYARVCDNAKGKVWIERKDPNATRWLKVPSVNPTYYGIAKSRKKAKAQQQQVQANQIQPNQAQPNLVEPNVVQPNHD